MCSNVPPPRLVRWLAAWCLLPWAGLSMAAVSDLLIALESDGRSHMVQHTVASNESLMIVELPGSVIPQAVRFMGPEHITFEHAHREQPDRIALWSGSAFARYAHQYGNEVALQEDGSFLLTMTSLPRNLSVEDDDTLDSAMTWVFPEVFDITHYETSDPDVGSWVAENNTLSFRQRGGQAVQLNIAYRPRPDESPSPADLCAAGVAPVDACAPDEDADGIPDYRDICLTSNGAEVSQFGCAPDASLLLPDIVFASGHSYLDATARRVLDRVAMALTQSPKTFYEVGAHTDNRGSSNRNRDLSRKRADAVRHYLMLRGVGPNRIRAKGYGEDFPIQDNETVAGQRANRRVELTRIE